MEIETSTQGLRLYNSCKGLSPKTITWSDAFLRHFGEFLRQHQHPTEISQPSISHLRAWVHHDQERGLSSPPQAPDTRVLLLSAESRS